MKPPATPATDKPALRARIRATRDAFHAAASPALTPPAPTVNHDEVLLGLIAEQLEMLAERLEQ